MLLLALLAAATEAAPSASSFSVKDWGIIGVMAAQGIAMLIWLQKGREAMAKEVAMVLDAKKEAAPMRVQDPLNVKAHVDYTPQAKHDELAGRVDSLREEVSSRVEELRAEMNTRFVEIARSSAESRGKLYDLLRGHGEKTAALAEKTELTSNRLVQMDTKIDTLLIRLGVRAKS